MRLAATALAVFAATAAHAERILLIPLDSRPAAGQFAQMIGRMADVDVRMPDAKLLGYFKTPGEPDRVLDWLEKQDYSDVSAVVVSVDMIGYGGLIESRENDVLRTEALARLRRLAKLHDRMEGAKLFLFSSTMRLAPTLTSETRTYAGILAKYAEFRARAQAAKQPILQTELKSLRGRIPDKALADYDAARKRNHDLQREAVRLTAQGAFEYLVIGQDDAKPHGPHIRETTELRTLTTSVGATRKVYFCEGIDQHANVLLSRALLTAAGWTPRVRIVYSDPLGAKKTANYESKPIWASLKDQLVASGARPVGRTEPYDYTLYLNTPNPRPAQLDKFLWAMRDEVDQGLPVAVADIDLGPTGTANSRLFGVLREKDRMMRLLSFAGWNTAGNTMVTTIPAANVILLARRQNVDPLHRELAQREFLLHRFVNDYAYHRLTRPKAYQIDPTSRYETYGEPLRNVEGFVGRDLEKYLRRYFDDAFRGRKFFAGNDAYIFSDIKGIKVFLPWPRAYEVRLEFHLEAQPVAAQAGPRRTTTKRQ